MNKHSTYRSLPLVYSCSGCSSAAQLANQVAVQLDRAQLAEMSCIAGVGGDVDSLVKVATSGRPIVALDGCPLQCVRNCLKRHGVEPTLHYTLSELGIRKRYHAEFSDDDARRVLTAVREDLLQGKATPEPLADEPLADEPRVAETA